MRAKLYTTTEGYVALHSFFTGVRAALEGFRHNPTVGPAASRKLKRIRREELKHKTLEMISRDRDEEEKEKV